MSNSEMMVFKMTPSHFPPIQDFDRTREMGDAAMRMILGALARYPDFNSLNPSFREVLLRRSYTVGFTSIRQSGKTEWILDFFKDSTIFAVVVMPNRHLLNDFLTRLKEKTSLETYEVLKTRVMLETEFDREVLHKDDSLPDLQMVIVDDARICRHAGVSTSYYEALAARPKLIATVTVG